jgi:ATP-dependent Clp protease ATP-binding subunit ClpC
MALFRRFTDRAKRALALGGSEAVRLGQPAVRPEDLLIGLLACGDTVAAQALASAGADLAKARAALEAATNVTDTPAEGEGISPNAATKEIMSLAGDEADRLGSSTVDPEHLLLALLAALGTSAGVLEVLGVDADAVRREIVEGGSRGN